jgi:hypothetical protein
MLIIFYHTIHIIRVGTYYAEEVESDIKAMYNVAFSEMFHRVALARTNISEESITSIIGMISSYHVSFASYYFVPRSLIIFTLMMEAIASSETSVLTRATRRNIPEDGVLHSHCRENLKSYKTCNLYSAKWRPESRMEHRL